jgi:hypothetical protein
VLEMGWASGQAAASNTLSQEVSAERCGIYRAQRDLDGCATSVSELSCSAADAYGLANLNSCTSQCVSYHIQRLLLTSIMRVQL